MSLYKEVIIYGWFPYKEVALYKEVIIYGWIPYKEVAIYKKFARYRDGFHMRR